MLLIAHSLWGLLHPLALAFDIIHQQVLAQVFDEGIEDPPLVDFGHLLDKLRQIAAAPIYIGCE